jgi:hypothetical protein
MNTDVNTVEDCAFLVVMTKSQAPRGFLPAPMIVKSLGRDKHIRATRNHHFPIRHHPLGFGKFGEMGENMFGLEKLVSWKWLGETLTLKVGHSFGILNPGWSQLHLIAEF